MIWNEIMIIVKNINVIIYKSEKCVVHFLNKFQLYLPLEMQWNQLCSDITSLVESSWV